MEQVATGFGLIEGPVWDHARGLYFSDVQNGGIFLLDPASKRIDTVLARRRGIGGMALHAHGGLVFGGRDIAWTDLKGGESRTLLSAQDIQGEVPGAIGFNDLTTDADGRIWVGSLAFRVFGGDEPKPGSLHVIDLDGSSRAVSGGVMLTNGLGFSPDGKRLHHSDSRSNLVRAYDIENGGVVGDWRPFAAFPPHGVPDGLKVASDGSVWVADADAGRVAVFSPDGAHLRDIAVSLPMVTSLCFGGADMKDLYIVTGSRGGPSENCGTIFKLRTDVAGQPLPVARVAL